MNGVCDFCPRPGRFAACHCEHGHHVGVWVCAEKHEPDLNSTDIACKLCDRGQQRCWVALYEDGYVPTGEPLPNFELGRVGVFRASDEGEMVTLRADEDLDEDTVAGLHDWLGRWLDKQELLHAWERANEASA